MRLLLIGVLAVGLAGCGQLPAPECDTNPSFADSPLSCDVAVATALAALPADHAAIKRIQFLFGSATPCCSTIYAEGEEGPVKGYVVFTYTGGAEQQYVPVGWWHGATEAGMPAGY